MSLGTLLKQLIDIEQAIDVQESATLRRMVLDAQDHVLEMRKLSVDDSRTLPGPIRLAARMVGIRL